MTHPMVAENATTQARATSAEGPGRPLVFVVGCPRSGTTWLQLLLAQHPDVATSNETNLFRYVAALERHWNEERRRSSARRATGLSSLLSPDTFDDACRRFALVALNAILAQRPTARVILEKTPAHLLHWSLILRLFPHAQFIHIIRDPRSVAASLLSAREAAWGREWAPSSVIEIAGQWRAAIEAGQALARATSRYLELRYEDLLARPTIELARSVEWLGLPHDPTSVAAAVAACDIDKLKAGAAPAAGAWDVTAEPPGFFRSGTADAWQHELSPRDIAVLEHVVRDQMETFGYRPTTPRRRRAPLRIHLNGVVERLDYGSRRIMRWLRG